MFKTAGTILRRDMTTITTPLRYPGGKSKALSKILPLVPLDFSEYREPFLGGGSVFIALKQLYPRATYRINDLNHDLYCFWITVRDNVDELVGEVIRIKKRCEDGKKLYKRLARSDSSDDFHHGLRFYILDRITYSGLVDSGGYSSEAFQKRFTQSNIDKLRPLSHLLQGVEITNQSYENPLLDRGKNVFIYLDPPYWNSRKSELYGRNGDLHKSFGHAQFAKNVSKCKHRWLITCDDSNLIRESFAFAYIRPWEMLYGMTNVKRDRINKGRELFITNYIPEECEVVPVPLSANTTLNDWPT
jgi:DNA adenine methylase